MIDSPMMQEILDEQFAERLQAAILAALGERYGPVPADLAASIRTVRDRDVLLKSHLLAGEARTYKSFRRKYDTLRRRPRGES